MNNYLDETDEAVHGLKADGRFESYQSTPGGTGSPRRR